jgi:hypothetical protein
MMPQRYGQLALVLDQTSPRQHSLVPGEFARVPNPRDDDRLRLTLAAVHGLVFCCQRGQTLFHRPS